MHRIRPATARAARRLLALLLILSPISVETPAGLSVLLVRSRRRGLVALPSIAGAAPDDGGGDEGGDGAGAEGGDGGGRGEPARAGAGDGGDGGEGGDEGGDGGDGEPDWKKRARQLERDLKRERTAKADLARTLAAQDEATKTEQQRAIDAAKREAGDAVRSELEAERRAERLESRVVSIAARGVKVGDDTRRFEDPEDALLYLQRAIRNGDVDADELFGSDGRVDAVKLTEALADILRERPRLAADTNNGSGAGRGSNDAGKGSAAAGSSLEGLTPQQIFERDQAASK